MALRGSETAANIRPPPSREAIQPAGVDLRVEKIFRFTEEGRLGVVFRHIPRVEEVPPAGGVWNLGPGGYKIRFAEAVSVPADAVGFCFPRSSLLRMGASIMCGVWDPGYVGRGEALLIVANPKGISIEVGARVAQLVMVRLTGVPERLYEGAFQGENLGGE